MTRLFNTIRCVLCYAVFSGVVAGIIGGATGVYYGYKLGAENVCDQIHYYYTDDVKVLACSRLNK